MHKSHSIFNTISDTQRLNANVLIQTTNDATNEPTSQRCNGRKSRTWTLSQKGRCLGGGVQVVRERSGAQWVAPRWFGKGQAPSGWLLAFLPRAFRDLCGVNDDDDDANARSNLALQLELRNQSKSTILK